MTVMFCQKCHQVTDCRVESPQPTHRSVYYDYPYINAYIRKRTCTVCNGTFKTYEIGEATFLTLRKITELSERAGALVYDTWCKTKVEYFNQFRNRQDNNIRKEYESDLEKMKSLLPDNVILFPNKDE